MCSDSCSQCHSTILCAGSVHGRCGRESTKGAGANGHISEHMGSPEIEQVLYMTDSNELECSLLSHDFSLMKKRSGGG